MNKFDVNDSSHVSQSPLPGVDTHRAIHSLFDSINHKEHKNTMVWSGSPSKTTHPRRSSMSFVATFVSSRGALIALLFFVCVVLGINAGVSKHGVRKTMQLVSLHVEGILTLGIGNGRTVVAKIYDDDETSSGGDKDKENMKKKKKEEEKEKKRTTGNDGISKKNNVDGFSFSRRDRALLIKHSFILKVKISESNNTIKNNTAIINNDIQTARQNNPRKRSSTASLKSRNKVENRQVVLMTIASQQVAHFLLNLRCYTMQTSNLYPILFALDENITHFARAWNVPSIAWYNSANSNGTSKMPIAPFGSKAFSQVSNTKLVIVYQVLKLGFDVWLTDVDIVWCTDLRMRFANMLAEYPNIDVFMQSNRKAENISGQVNTGFYYAKATKGSIDMFKDVADNIPSAVKKRSDDQTLFYNTACAGGRTVSNKTGGTGTTKPRLMEDGSGRYETFCEWRYGKCRLMFLPLYEFMNGAVEPKNETTGVGIKWRGMTGYLGNMCKEKRIGIWHANWIPGHAKRYHMIRQRLWILRENYTCGTL